MKFLAMLRDSLREAIDAKVFYVMIGLSLLLIALAISCTFKPTPGGQMVMEWASAPLNLDVSNLDLSNTEQQNMFAELMRRSHSQLYRVTRVRPEEGSEDLPSTRFHVFLTVGINPLKPFASPESAEEHIRQNFGKLDKWQVAEVIDVKRLGEKRPAEYEVTARVTPEGRRLWPHDFSLFFGAVPLFKMGVPLSIQLWVLEDVVVNGIGAWVTILVSIIITSFFIPNMLRKGAIDLLLAKPMGRGRLLLYKYVGGLLFILLNTAVAIGGVWLALSLRSGVWGPSFLLLIPLITFYFAILYSVSTLFAVLTRSPIVAIMMTCLFATLLYAVGALHSFFEATRKQENQMRALFGPRLLAAAVGVSAAPGQGLFSATVPLVGGTLPPPAQPPWIGPVLQERLFADNWFARGVAGIHFVLPRSHDLSNLTTTLLLRDLIFNNQIGTRIISPTPISWGESLTVSGIFIALMLGLSCWRFATRDY
jgi:ABC-type transport system involved in multi-copper enzyme maturation permease subunit